MLLAGILAVATIFAYRPAWHGGFIWDDDDYVTKNRLLTAEDGLRRIWFSLDAPSQYFPLTYTTFRIERQLWGLNPTGYHWVNILLHAANAILLWKLLRRLKVPGAYLAALIFALHPVQVESVAWISERKNVLMGLFFLLTLHAWRSFTEQADSPTRWRPYWLGLIAFAAALAAKTTACTLPAALLLMLWFEHRPITRARLLQVIPFLGLGLFMGTITVLWERYHVGTRGPMFEMAALDRLLIACRGVWFYLSKLFWPTDLTFIYPQWTMSATDPWSYLGLIGCVAAGVMIYLLRHRVGRGLEVATVFFVATLSPLLGFIMLYTFRYTYVADHYQYLACIGPIALVAAGITAIGRIVKYERQTEIVASVVLILLLGGLTAHQASMYSNMETLWRTTIARNPVCWMAYNNLGIALFDKGDVDDAIAQYRRSLELRSNYAQTHYNLGMALLDKGNIPEAVAHAREAVRLQPRDPDAHVALGNALLPGSVEDAIAEYKTAIELRPNHANAHYNLGNALVNKGEIDAAVTEFVTATTLQPDLVEGHVHLADIMTQRGNWREAISQYDRVLESQPNDPGTCNNLAWILASCPEASLRNGGRAVELAQRAGRFGDKESSVIVHTLAAGYAQNRQFELAVQAAEHALDLALAEGNASLAEDLRREIEIYRRGLPYPES